MGRRVLKPDQVLALLVDLVLDPTEPSGSIRAIASNAASVMAILIMSAPVFALVKAAAPWREYLHGGTRRRCREGRQPDPNFCSQSLGVRDRR